MPETTLSSLPSSLTTLMFGLGGAAEIDVDDASFASARADDLDVPPAPPQGPEGTAAEGDLWLGWYWLGVRVGLVGFGAFLGRALALALL